MTAFSPPVILTAVVMAAVALRSSAADKLPLVDLSGETSRHVVIAAGTEKDYQGHPTTAMTADGRVIAVWCTPHGGWCGPAAETDDGGKSWKRIDSRFPEGFRRHVNCPSIYRLAAPDGKERMWVWSQAKMPLDAKHHRDRRWRGEAMPSVMSEDEGRTWKEMPPLGPKFRCVMAFASIVRLRDGSYLGMFHRGPGGADKSPLTVWQSVTKDGGFTWSDPVLVASAKGKDLCEPYVFRSPKGDELCCLLRENTHKGASMMMFSRDEGKTWTKPEDAPWGLTGDRHQGIRLPDGRLVVVFREMAPNSPEKGHFVAWVGSYDAIKSRKTNGTYRVKLLHNYATVDCGYPGIHLLPDGTILATTYCKYRNDKRKHSVVSVRFRVDETDLRVANAGISDTYGRILSWEGVGNVRDLGGLPAADGSRLRRGMIFRSQALNNNAICNWLTADRLERKIRNGQLAVEFGTNNWAVIKQRIGTNNLRKACVQIAAEWVGSTNRWKRGEARGTAESRRRILRETGLKTEIDLRSKAECWGMDGSPLGAGVKWINIPGVPISELVTSTGQRFFKKVFPIFLSRKNYPINFHCIAGADRTGALAFALEALLGVSEKDMIEDYVLTSLSSSGRRTKDSFVKMAKVFEAYPGATLNDRVEAYVLDCGFTREDIAKFRSIMLEIPSSAVGGLPAKDKSRNSAERLVARFGADGTAACSDAIQRLIDENPNREIFFPDGTYLLDKPVCTPAHPKKSVSLSLSAYAKFKAVPGWKYSEAMVRLGAIHPAKNIWLPGSCYWLKGGIIDGGGVAKGVSIDGGRETLIAEVSMKNVLVGIHVKYGANHGSSDADIRNVNIVGNNAPDSIGILVDGNDNTFANVRIYAVAKGMVINGGGCSCRDIHPLLAMTSREVYEGSIGFEINTRNVWMDYCYSDQFATGFHFGPRGGGILDKCFVYWYKSTPDMRHVAFSSGGKFNAKVKSPVVTFSNPAATNCLVCAKVPEGKGYLQDVNCRLDLINDPVDSHGNYLR